MNRNRKQAETATLQFPPDVAAVSLTESATRRCEVLKLRASECRITLPAGTGRLLTLR